MEFKSLTRAALSCGDASEHQQDFEVSLFTRSIAHGLSHHRKVTIHIIHYNIGKRCAANAHTEKAVRGSRDPTWFHLPVKGTSVTEHLLAAVRAPQRCRVVRVDWLISARDGSQEDVAAAAGGARRGRRASRRLSSVVRRPRRPRRARQGESLSAKSHRRETIAATGSDAISKKIQLCRDAHWKDRLCLIMFHAFTNSLLLT